MSFYWQQGLSQDTNQSQQQGAPQQGQWDFINLGGAPAPQHQWNPTAQQQQQHNYYYQQPPQQNYAQQHNGPVQQYNHDYNASQQTQWMNQQPQVQQVQLAQHQPQLAQHQPQLPQKIEHTPLLPQHQYVPPVQHVPVASHQPQIQNQSQSHPQQAYFPPPPVPQLEVIPEPEVVQPVHVPVPAVPLVQTPVEIIPPTKEEVLTVAAPPTVAVEEPKTKITPTSSEDDWEKADMEVQRVDDENKRQKDTLQSEKPEESRESSSLGGSWSQQETEPSERSSAEPVEIVEPIIHPAPVVEEEKEEKTPRVSMSENFEPAPVPVNIHLEERQERQETPDAQNITSASALNHSSPGTAIATSTPKDVKPEKRSSVSSQGTVGGEKEKTAPKQKKEKQVEPVFKAPAAVVEKEEQSGNNSDSTLASGKPDFERGHARASYREYKKTYLEICDRLKMMRTDSHHSDFRPSSKLANPLLAAAGLSRHPAIRRESTGGRNDGRASVPLHHSQSFTENPYQNQNGGRRSRVSRLDPNARPSSRQAAGYQSANLSYNDPRMMNSFDPRFQQPQQQHNAYYRQGRYSSMGIPYRHGQEGYDARRPQSTYMMEQYSTAYPPQEPQETSSMSESEEEDENAESDDEIRRYNTQQQQIRRAQGADAQYYQQNVGEDGDALYFCGVVHVNMDTWRHIKEKFAIPQEFYALPPIEKAAFMFYAVVFKQPYKNVDAFHKRFNREFYKYVCAGDSDDDALFKICRSMQQQYIERQKEKELAYQNMKATLFSDETSIDGQSEINSVYEESAIDVYKNGPLKFTCPHTFLNISTGGQIISVQPDQSVSAVVFDDIKSMLKDFPTLRVKEAAQSFKGPLIPNQSAPHTVRLYISKQIENIQRSDVARENSEANDVVESLLVWQLLETMVKQQGNITGPDIAELLAKVADQPVHIEAPPQLSDITPALTQFTQFLLGGHIDEAVESAMRNGLFADALVLTRRLFPNDERRIEQIESRFLQTRSLSNPVTTLVSVAKGEAPPVLTNPPLDDHLSWRTHAAIILANLDQRGTAMNTIYQLGRALAKRDYHCAADFCFLVYCVLGGNNPFEPIQAPEGEEEYRRHISLINADIPDNESNPKCQYGFLISDLHATEIFDYALRLKPDRESPLGKSVEYQTARIKYAKLLANHGYNTDAYRYCTEIARAIWFHVSSFKPEDLLELCDLAESLHFAACVDPSETQWINDLRATVQAGFIPRVAETPATQEVEVATQNYSYQPEPVYEIPTEPLKPTPAPSEYAPPQEEVPPTPTGSIAPEATPQYDSPFSYPTHQQHQPKIDEEDGFTAQPEYNDGPLTMASSLPAAVPEQTQPPPVDIWSQSAQSHTQPPLPSHESVQPEPVAPPPSATPAIPTAAPPAGPGAGAGAGFRAARGTNRYAKVASSNDAPAGMRPPAPPTASFGFMPAPMDDDADSVDPFSGQANPTIQQTPQNQNQE